MVDLTQHGIQFFHGFTSLEIKVQDIETFSPFAKELARKLLGVNDRAVDQPFPYNYGRGATQNGNGNGNWL